MPLVSRYIVSAATMLVVAGGSEFVRAWPADFPTAGFIGMLGLQVVVLSALWVLPVAGLELTGLVLWRRLRGDRPPLELSWLPIIPPAAFACVTVGQMVHTWSAKAFVRQDLAGAAIPGVQLFLFATIAGLAAMFYALAARRHLCRLPRWGHVAAFAGGALLFGGTHIARFPALLQDALVPVALQVLVTATAGLAAFALPARWVRRQPRWIAGGVALAGLATLAIVMLFGGRVAPLTYPVAASALQARGLAAARMTRLTVGLGDADGDGFSRFFGGTDCDDGNPEVNPLAKDLPDNGIDEDCFEGDLTTRQLERDRATRAVAQAPLRRRVRNVVLVTADTVRADAVGFGGAKHPSTPNLDAIAKRGAVFSAAYTQAPMTRRAFPSLLTGRYPSNVHWLDQNTNYIYTVVHQDNLLLAEILRDAGLKTAAVLAFSYASLGHFDQGLQVHKIHPASRFKKEINADVIIDDAIKLLRGWSTQPTRPPFFLWVHFYEAHYPYEKHPGINFGKTDQQRYLGEIRWIDDQLGRLFAELESQGFADETAIIFTSDHGEEFGDHGDKWHGDLYPEDLHVPMFIYVPGMEPASFATPVGLIDIAPTMLDLLGLPIPQEVDGISLLPWLEGQPPPENRAIFAELIPDTKVPRRIVALIDRHWHYIADFRFDGRELFNLDTDRSAQRNLLTEAPSQAASMEQQLRSYMALRIGPLRITKAKKPGKPKPGK